MPERDRQGPVCSGWEGGTRNTHGGDMRQSLGGPVPNLRLHLGMISSQRSSCHLGWRLKDKRKRRYSESCEPGRAQEQALACPTPFLSGSVCHQHGCPHPLSTSLSSLSRHPSPYPTSLSLPSLSSPRWLSGSLYDCQEHRKGSGRGREAEPSTFALEEHASWGGCWGAGRVTGP